MIPPGARPTPRAAALHSRPDGARPGLSAGADGLRVATPGYTASCSGARKGRLDLVPERALEHKVVLPFATGGSSAH
ncbi:NADPH-dependent FMN reductase, partial [Pseudomonas aeruginosa]